VQKLFQNKRSCWKVTSTWPQYTPPYKTDIFRPNPIAEYQPANMRCHSLYCYATELPCLLYETFARFDRSTRQTLPALAPDAVKWHHGNLLVSLSSHTLLYKQEAGSSVFCSRDVPSNVISFNLKENKQTDNSSRRR